MAVMDTNAVSELMRITPDPAVLAWFSGHDSAELHLTAATEAELRAGAAILPFDRYLSLFGNLPCIATSNR